MRPFHALVGGLVLLTISGCHVSTHKDGKNENVDIGTPFGSMHVKTNDNVDTAGIGITPYPGAQIAKKDNKNDGAADVNMSFGTFHLGVKAASLVTADDPDKVLAFYKKDLSKYGDVLECQGRHAVGSPDRTAEGLTCDFDNNRSAHIEWNTDGNHNTELRCGSKEHQHIVAVEKKDGQTKIGLVSLDLPTSLMHHGNNPRDTD